MRAATRSAPSLHTASMRRREHSPAWRTRRSTRGRCPIRSPSIGPDASSTWGTTTPTRCPCSLWTSRRALCAWPSRDRRSSCPACSRKSSSSVRSSTLPANVRCCEGVSADDPRIGTILQGRYRILDAIAAGGMGVVYRGERVGLERIVAVKFLHGEVATQEQFRKRFEIEARAMSRLSHPHCVSVIDFGVVDVPYFVMDYVTGRPLGKLIEEGPIPIRRALHITRQLLAGLAHAHGQGIVHRAIKPEHLLLEEELR